MSKDEKKPAVKEYVIISGSYSTFVDGVRTKHRAGEVIELTEEKAKKLVNIVRPVNYDPKPVEAPESVKFAQDESLRPINEIGAGLPQDADKPAEIEDGKTDEVLEAAAKESTTKEPATAPGTKTVAPAKK